MLLNCSLTLIEQNYTSNLPVCTCHYYKPSLMCIMLPTIFRNLFYTHVSLLRIYLSLMLMVICIHKNTLQIMAQK